MRLGIVCLLICASAGGALAQVSCTHNGAVQPILLHGSITEPAGDIVLGCSGGAAGEYVVLADFGLPVRNFGDAAVLVNDPDPGTQQLGRNVFRCWLNTLTQVRCPVQLPGGSGTTPIRLVNFRVDTEYATPGQFSGTISLLNPLGAQVFSAAVPYQIQNWFSVTVAGATNRSTAVATNPAFVNPDTVNCANNNFPSAPQDGGGAVFTELFPFAFRQQLNGNEAQPGAAHANSETGFFNATGSLGASATHGTRFKVSIQNVPTGVSVFAPVTATATGLTVTLNSTLTGALTPATGVCNTGLSKIPLVNGAGSVVYEVTKRDPAITTTTGVRINLYPAYNPGVPAAAIRVLPWVDQNVPGKFDLSDGIPADVPSFAMPLTPGYFLGPNLSTPNASTALVADPALTSFEYAAAAPTATGPAAIDPRRFIGSATKNVRISTVDFSAHTCTFGPLPRELKASSIIPGTPLTVSVTFDPTGVAVGQHNATLSVTCPGTANSPLTYPISYTVDAPAPFIFPGGVVNGADYVSDEVAPGSLVNVYFDGDPSTDPLTLGTFDSAGKLSTTVDGKQVLWQALTSAGGTQLIASPIIYTAPNVVSTLAPFAIGNGTVTALQVVSGSAKTPFYNLPVAPRAPGFLTGGSGSGQAAVLNQDNSFNAVTPAEQKEILTFFAVGAGTTTPPSVDGATVNGPYPTPNGQVSLDFLIPGPNGAPTRVPAPISYAGAAPGLVSGVLQVNAAVPPNVPSGANVVVLTVGANSSPAVATVQVK